MFFSSILFIFIYLPILLITYYLCPIKYRNYILLLFSIIFYFIGEPKIIIFLFLSSIINYYSAKLITKYPKYKKIILIINLIYNISMLFYFKYIDFIIKNINLLFNTNFNLFYAILPIGISFYTFQGISYVIDIYNNKINNAKIIFDFMTYLFLFPQLIAGPIVRYKDISDDMNNRKFNIDNFSNGIKRLIIGLSKKVLLANVLGELIKKITIETVLSSWLKPVLYTLQLFFDLSCYSDMAIGLGLLFGFTFLEIFNYPLKATSITDFWRRWHISLSSWFRDYLYIPLGGNKCSKLRNCLNIIIVWFLTGLWHGDNWTFIIWGLYFGLILIIEKTFYLDKLNKTKIIKYIYTTILIAISFLIFSSSNLNELINNLKNMFFINKLDLINKETIFYLKDYLLIILISILCATPLIKNIFNKINKIKYLNLIEIITYLILFILSISFIIDASFNPFLYFRF